MEIWKGLANPAQKFHGGSVTIGNFDGLHLGHQSLIQAMRRVPRVVITFDPHPLQVLYPERSLRRIFPRDDLAERLEAMDIALLLILDFNREFAGLNATRFLQEYVQVPFQPAHVVAGYDFAFGSGREGTLSTLHAWAKQNRIAVDVPPPFTMAGEIVSSRRLRELILLGEVARARLLLGRPFYLRGEVVTGAGRGAQIGVPTLNQKVINETLPLGGVYASRTRFAGRLYPSVTNIGTNPTFESGRAVKVETHVFDAHVEARGKGVDVELIERLREEKKFASIEDLKIQIQSDMLKARRILEKVK